MYGLHEINSNSSINKNQKKQKPMSKKIKKLKKKLMNDAMELSKPRKQTWRTIKKPGDNSKDDSLF